MINDPRWNHALASYQDYPNDMTWEFLLKTCRDIERDTILGLESVVDNEA